MIRRWSKPGAHLQQSLLIKQCFSEGRYKDRNHKVVKVEYLKEKEDCFDLIMESNHNFAISAGVFIHNSGHDSNINKNLVMKVTEQYKKKFYNTSLPNFDFPGPVVFTCNGRDTDYSALMVIKGLENVMHVRFRTNTWNLDLLDEVIDFYACKHSIPVTITFMRYTDPTNIPVGHMKYYDFHKSILNMYYCLCREEQQRILDSNGTEDRMIGMCGTPESSYCRDCG